MIFEEEEILKSDNNPYTIFTPYKNRWLKNLEGKLPLRIFDSFKAKQNFIPNAIFNFLLLRRLGFKISSIKVKPYDLNAIKEYHKYRDYPALLIKPATWDPICRFGTVSIRKMVDSCITGKSGISE